MWGASWDSEGQKQGCLSLALTCADGQLATPSPPRRREDQYWRDRMGKSWLFGGGNWRDWSAREASFLHPFSSKARGWRGKTHPSTGTGGWPLPIT